MYIEDLDRYKYIANSPSNMLCIGWLAKEHKFQQGEVPTAFMEKLLLFCEKPENLTRGFHVCDLCQIQQPGEYPRMLFVLKPDGQKLHLGNGEVHVKNACGETYSAPTLIYHYILKHKYLPPQDFIDAVCRCDLEWKAREPVKKSLWQRLKSLLHS